MAIAYWTFAGITFAIAVSAFLKDREARKHDNKAFLFITLTTLLWPITLPCMVTAKIRRAKAIRLSKQYRKRQVECSQKVEAMPGLSSFHP